MKKHIDEKELQARIELNYQRFLGDPYYTIERVFMPKEYNWPGDKEGRALLAYVSHYKISGRQIPCMKQMLDMMPEKTNEHLFFGPLATDIIFEQQLSGHSWLLRGLCEYYEQFGDEACLMQIRSIIENLYMPTKGHYCTYPIHRAEHSDGDVSGTNVGIIGNWNLSSDIGCAFMSIDGLSHAYRITKDPAVQELLDEMIGIYLSIDKVSLKAQTHCTLTAARGMLRMYQETGDRKYLDGAKAIYELYVHGGGMTHTYQNLNWWGRPDSWTEPCAIVDSLMVALELYKYEQDPKYRTVAARIYHNGLSTAQRANGGAGTDRLVCPGSDNDSLITRMYEAPFCCTMRLAEGLWYISQNKDYLYAETTGTVIKNANGTYSDGDILYAEASEGLRPYATDTVHIDGRTLSPIVKYYQVPKEIMEQGRQRILF